MAGEHLHHDGVLVPLLEEREDSGIDSDDTDTDRGHIRQPYNNDEMPETSSSDEECVVKKVCAGRALNDNSNNSDDSWKDCHGDMIPMFPLGKRSCCDSHQEFDRCSLDRSSSPLYEVELTASDEDDDGSVLELVIPMQKNNYNNDKTSTSLKYFLAANKAFLTLICCPRYYN